MIMNDRKVKLSHKEIKVLNSRLYHLCEKLYGLEFNAVFSEPKVYFARWLNEKTGLNENIIEEPVLAAIGWLHVLEKLYSSR